MPSPAFTITVSSEKPSRIQAEVVVLAIHTIDELDTLLPAAAAKSIKAHARKVSFSGEWGKAEIMPAPRGLQAEFIALVGLGGSEASADEQAEGMRRGLGSIIQDSRRHMARTVAVAFASKGAAVSALARAAVESASLANYRFTAYSRKRAEDQKARSLKKVTILSSPDDVRAVRAEVRNTKDVMDGVHLALDLVNQPASHMSPRLLVEIAEQIASRSPNISLKVYNREQARRRGFSAFLAVARGSKEEPYVIHLTYAPPILTRKNIAIIGKGVTFDSGGLSLKPAQNMENMKSDMAGAAAVLGAFSSLDQVKPAAKIHGIIAACENMPSGEAFRPGDVVTAKNGKTIEVLNTDAEGRITLADALVYAGEQKPDVMIDLATLTGAAVVALGETHAGMWSTDKAVEEGLLRASKSSGESLVSLPLPPEYEQTIESKIADLRNIATVNFGGATTAALFLRHFTGGVPWAHLDIAGPAFIERPLLSYHPFGATGYGVRLLVEFLKNLE